MVSGLTFKSLTHFVFVVFFLVCIVYDSGPEMIDYNCLSKL